MQLCDQRPGRVIRSITIYFSVAYASRVHFLHGLSGKHWGKSGKDLPTLVSAPKGGKLALSSTTLHKPNSHGRGAAAESIRHGGSERGLTLGDSTFFDYF